MIRKLLPRNRLFVSSRIQGQLVIRLGLYWVLYHFVLWHAMFAYHFVQARMTGAHIGQSFQELYGSFVLQYYPIILCAVCMLPIFLVDLLRLSHRIAGPLVRFHAALRGMIAGEPVRTIKLRKGDLMSELEETFNEYIPVYERQRQQHAAPAAMLSEGEARRIAEIVEPSAELASAGR